MARSPIKHQRTPGKHGTGPGDIGVGLREHDGMPRIALFILLLMSSTMAPAEPTPVPGLIDDFQTEGISRIGTRWRLATDQVMGGVSEATMQWRRVDGRPALCLTGDVSLENNGGFVQVNLDLGRGSALDAEAFSGIRLLVRGNGATYNVHLKTPATVLPWQSYRAAFVADTDWREVRLPFADFSPHRLNARLDTRRLRRLGIVAIGRAMHADICIAEVGLY
jgi:hypothetical protein